MSSIKFELELNDLFAFDGDSDCGVNFNDWVQTEISQQIEENLASKVNSAIDNKIKEIMNEQLKNIDLKIGEKLNTFMDEFFTTTYDVRDKYGDIVKKDVCVKSLLKEACDNFVNQNVDEQGKPTNSTYYKTMTRVEYMVKKSWENELKYATDKLAREYTETIKKKLQDEISKQLGNKLSNLVGLESLLN